MTAGNGGSERRGSERVDARDGRWRRVKGDRDAGTTLGLAGRSRRGTASCRGTASRRRGRRSEPLTRPWESTLRGRDRRSPRSNGATSAGRSRTRCPGPTSRPPNPASRRGRGSGGWPPACAPCTARVRYAALGTSRPMARNSSSRARLARRFASRSDIAWATSSRPAKVVPGFRKRSASGSDLSFS